VNGDLDRLQLGQGVGDIARVGAFRQHAGFHRIFVHASRGRLIGHARAIQHRAPGCALRRQHDA
jgi:hypothetical protein